MFAWRRRSWRIYFFASNCCDAIEVHTQRPGIVVPLCLRAISILTCDGCWIVFFSVFDQPSFCTCSLTTDPYRTNPILYFAPLHEYGQMSTDDIEWERSSKYEFASRWHIVVYGERKLLLMGIYFSKSFGGRQRRVGKKGWRERLHGLIRWLSLFF